MDKGRWLGADGLWLEDENIALLKNAAGGYTLRSW